jgi:hypothetical protein
VFFYFIREKAGNVVEFDELLEIRSKKVDGFIKGLTDSGQSAVVGR